MTEPSPKIVTPILRDLRELGWQFWDPLDLVADRLHCDDEYDNYLLQALGYFNVGCSVAEVRDYLSWIERIYMGAGEVDDALQRATELATAIEQHYHTKVRN